MNPLPLVAVAGSPNAGKSALFNALTGARQKVGNYPGVTVERHSTRQARTRPSLGTFFWASRRASANPTRWSSSSMRRTSTITCASRSS